MAIEIIKNAKIMWGAVDISSESNEVSIRFSRPVVSHESFGDTSLGKDPGSRDEEIGLTVWYSEGADQALTVLESAYTAGSKHTITITPKGAGKVYTASVFVSELPVSLAKGEKSKISVTLPVDGHVTIA